MKRPAIIIGLHALGALAGYLAMLAGIPLPWMIGPIAVASLVTPVTGLNGSAVPLRMFGQLIIGVAMGLYLVPEAVARIFGSIGPIGISAALTVLAAVLLGWLQARLLHLDSATAIYSSVPGGPVDMALLAQHHGGDPARTALAQTMRIILIVVLFPQVLLALGAVNAPHDVDPIVTGELGSLALLLLFGVGASFAARRMRLLNPFFMGPLLLVGTLTALGIELPSVSIWLTAFAQVLLGISIGSMFHRDLFRTGAATICMSVLTTLILFALCIAIALGLHAVFGLDVAEMILSTAPGGATEMAVTARAMELDVPLVVAFQVFRVILIAILLPALFRTFSRFF